MTIASEPEPSEVTAPVTGDEAEAAACPRCGTPRGADDAFCEECGHDLSTSGVNSRDDRWEVEIVADRELYSRVQADGIEFPGDAPARRIDLDGNEVTVGRSSTARGIRPAIDASGPPEDTGVSHRHAAFRRGTDGGWSIVDTDSTNGTFVNDGEQPIPPGQPVALADGDRVHVGAWTTIIVHVTKVGR